MMIRVQGTLISKMQKIHNLNLAVKKTKKNLRITAMIPMTKGKLQNNPRLVLELLVTRIKTQSSKLKNKR